MRCCRRAIVSNLRRTRFKQRWQSISDWELIVAAVSVVAISVMVALVAWGALLRVLPTVRADTLGFFRLLKLQVSRAG